MVRIFPDRTFLTRPVGAVLTDHHDEWAESRRYLCLEALNRSRLSLVPTTHAEQEDIPDVGAPSA